MAIVACFAFVAVAQAEDLILDVTVDSITAAIDKNGNSYTRVIISEQRSLDGVTYNATVPIMFFGALHEAAQSQISAKDKIKVLVNKRQYQGNHSYTARKLL